MDNKDIVILAGKGSGSGGSVTAAAVANAIENMSDDQVAQARSDLGAEPEKLTVTITKTGNQYASDKTYAEITAAVAAGKIVAATYAGTEVYLASAESMLDIRFFSIVPKNNMDFSQGFDLTLYALASNEAMTVATIDYITIDATLSNSSTNPVQNKVIDAALALKADASALNNKADKATVVTDLSSTSITLAAAANTEYNYGELSALTITAIASPGEFSITFTSGATATILTVPNTMIMPDGFAVEANTRYEINCKDGYALVAGWEVSAE